MTLDEQLLKILACPKCKGDLQHQNQKNKETLTCQTCKLQYTVEDGIPIMLIDKATKIE